MYTLERIQATIADMDDHELIQRWMSNSFSDDALTIAKAELEKRGIDPNAPRVRDIEVAAVLVQKNKPSWAERTVPALFGLGAAGGMATAFRYLWGLPGVIAALAFFYPLGYAAGYLLYLKIREWRRSGAVGVTVAILIVWVFMWAFAAQVFLHGLRNYRS